jgi:nitroreductase/NAD-dependent dihydropyrimidine dehydrogenase PreA subunit
MELLTIDRNKCKKDRLCERDCPIAIIHMSEADGFPYIAAEDEKACLTCGHCVAICPYGALEHRLAPLKECPEIDEKLAITEKQATQFLRSRRSIRVYKDKPVKKERIQQLIEVARYAPTGGNAQAIEWLVLMDSKKIHDIAGLIIEWCRNLLRETPAIAEIAPFMPAFVRGWDNGNDTIFRRAPSLVIAHIPANGFGDIADVSLALAYLELFAPTIGLGACWCGMVRAAASQSPAIKAAIGIPEGSVHYGALMLGYPGIKRYYRLPKRKEPKIVYV